MPRCDQTLSQGSAAAVPPGQSAQPRGTTSYRRHARQLSACALSAFARAPCAVRAGAHAHRRRSPAPEDRAPVVISDHGSGGPRCTGLSGPRSPPRRSARASPPRPLRRRPRSRGCAHRRQRVGSGQILPTPISRCGLICCKPGRAVTWRSREAPPATATRVVHTARGNAGHAANRARVAECRLRRRVTVSRERNALDTIIATMNSPADRGLRRLREQAAIRR